RLLAGHLEGAASLLARAPGLGWSRDDHLGHVLFPALSWALGGEPPGLLRPARGGVGARPRRTAREAPPSLHAAPLVACCVELDASRSGSGRPSRMPARRTPGSSSWARRARRAWRSSRRSPPGVTALAMAYLEDQGADAQGLAMQLALALDAVYAGRLGRPPRQVGQRDVERALDEAERAFLELGEMEPELALRRMLHRRE